MMERSKGLPCGSSVVNCDWCGGPGCFNLFGHVQGYCVLEVIKIAYIAWPYEKSHPISSIEQLFSVELYIHFLLHTSIF